MKRRAENSYFSRTCRVCQYCKQGHMKFHEALLNTKHFSVNNRDTVQHVWQEFQPSVNGQLIPYTTIMQHVRRHLIPAHEKIYERSIVKEALEGKDVVTKDELREALSGEVVEGRSKAEQTLDEFIEEFDRLVQSGKVKITAQNGLQAIKIRADIDKANKDRKVDFMKAFANRGKEGNGQS